MVDRLPVGKVLDIAARLIALLASVFCTALILAGFGYENALVMLWMIVGPILFFGSLALLAIHTVMRIAAPRWIVVSPSLFLAVGLSLLGFVLLKLLAGNSLMPVIGAALLGLGLATVIPRLSIRWLAEVSGLCLALASWFFDEWLLLAISATVYLIALSVTASGGGQRIRNGAAQ